MQEHILENLRRYDDALNELELAPNGDDYNALMDMVDGLPYHPPHREGR